MNIGEFHDVREIGHGGMGVVYQGFYGNKKVAIKEIRHDYMSETELIKRFQLEARVLEKLDHPSIVKIVKPLHYDNAKYYPAFEYNGNLYIAMEFVEGLTLDKYIRNNGGPLQERYAVELMCKILDAMEHVRQQGLVHRDIKPSNIIVKPNKDICIIDFGIAKDIHSNGMTTGRCILGTNGYMSPEQAEGGLTIDSRTDIYSLGCVLFYMVTGVHAIQTRGSDLETRLAIIKESFPRAKDYNPLISDKLQRVIDRAVDKNMLKRFQSAREFYRELVSGSSTNILTGNPDKYMTGIVVGRDSNSDIVVYDPAEKVSRRHLTVSWDADSSDGAVMLTYYDHSTNGSMINGKYINNDSISILYSASLGPDTIPVIILAGTVELSWEDISKAICKKVGRDIFVRQSIDESFPPDPPQPVRKDRLGFGYGFLAFICPLAGWILNAKWKEKYPDKAKAANIIAWVSFVMGLISNIIITNI